jgi:hypothetical protein
MQRDARLRAVDGCNYCIIGLQLLHIGQIWDRKQVASVWRGIWGHVFLNLAGGCNGGRFARELLPTKCLGLGH